MKSKYLKYISGAVLALALTGCDSFLDDQPRGKAIAETTDEYNGMFNTIEFMNLSMADYNHWLNDDIRMTPELFSQVSSWAYDLKQSSVERAYRLEKNVYETTENCVAWQSCYKNIYTFNVIANGVMESTGGTEAEKKAVRAEARISRAWMHFILAQMFAPMWKPGVNDDELAIPIVKEANTQASDFERATLKDLYEFIITEMEESCPDLLDRKEHNMRVYKTTGYALLGKMYWMTGQYDKAIEPLKVAYERLQSDKTCYLRDFNELMAQYDYQPLTPEQLYDENIAGNHLLPYTWGNPEMLWVKQNTNFMGIFYLYYMNMVQYYLNPEVFNLFDENDLRRNLLTTVQSDELGKEMIVGAIRDQTQNYGVEIPEVYLALAESEARAGDEANARKVIEEFRSYRVRTGHEGVPASVQTKAQLVKFCLDEEHREFLGRLQRVWNLRRLWDDEYFQSEKPIMHDDGEKQYTMSEDNLFFDLPETILQWNPNWR